MKVSIQVCLVNGWSNNLPVIHEFQTVKQAVDFAYALSHQHGNASVRVTYPVDGVRISIDYISRLNGTYIQSTETNYQYPEK